MGKGKQQNKSAPDTGVNGLTTERPVSELRDIGGHVGKLRQTTLTTQTIVGFLANQLEGLSVTIPVLRGFEILDELTESSKGRREGIQSGFGSLRAYIEQEKSLFFAKNAKVIEQIIRERVSEGIKKKLPVVLKEKLGRYSEYLKTGNVLTDKVKQVTVTASARAANSLLSTKYPDEQVILIPPNPDLGGMTLGNLKNIGGPAIARLASHQGLTPSEGQPDSEMARVNNLNMVLKHLGIQYQALPSWNGILLTSVSRKEHL